VPNKPNRWIAALLGIFSPPIGMMYVAQIRWAGIYFLFFLAAGVLSTFYFRVEAAALAILTFVRFICAAHAYCLAASHPDEKPRPAYSRWYVLLGVVMGFVLVTFVVRSFIFEIFRFPSGSMLPTIPLRSNLIVQKWGYGYYGAYGIRLSRSSISAPLSRGDLIVFEYPPDRSITFAKRLIGLPGDTVEYRNKHLIINGQPVKTHRTGMHLYRTPGLDSTQSEAYTESLNAGPHAILMQPELPPVHLKHVTAFPHRNHCQYDEAGFICNVPEGHYFMLGDNRDASNDSRYWGFVPSNHIIGKALYILS
jgi:signal peptidase I